MYNPTGPVPLAVQAQSFNFRPAMAVAPSSGTSATGSPLKMFGANLLKQESSPPGSSEPFPVLLRDPYAGWRSASTGSSVTAVEDPAVATLTHKSYMASELAVQGNLSEADIERAFQL
jgi:hypothetical protein